MKNSVDSITSFEKKTSYRNKVLICFQSNTLVKSEEIFS